MILTPWFPPNTNPVREGWYERDYARAIPDGGIYRDLWLQNYPGNGYWYVDEGDGGINDAHYACLPWRGVLK